MPFCLLGVLSAIVTDMMWLSGVGRAARYKESHKGNCFLGSREQKARNVEILKTAEMHSFIIWGLKSEVKLLVGSHILPIWEGSSPACFSFWCVQVFVAVALLQHVPLSTPPFPQVSLSHLSVSSLPLFSCEHQPLDLVPLKAPWGSA